MWNPRLEELRFICHSRLRRGNEVWGFNEKAGNSQVDEKEWTIGEQIYAGLPSNKRTQKEVQVIGFATLLSVIFSSYVMRLRWFSLSLSRFSYLNYFRQEMGEGQKSFLSLLLLKNNQLKINIPKSIYLGGKTLVFFDII